MEVGTWGFTIAGLVVGFIVGMTGVGGGSLMTPILLWFGINPATAVGTDLLYAAITKASGVWVHGRNKNIDWKITGWLALGSVPAAAFVLWYLKSLNAEPQAMGVVIKQALAVVLFLTALAILFKKRLQALASRHAGDRYNLSPNTLNALTVVTGVVLGVMVSPDLDRRRCLGDGGVVHAVSVPGDPAPGGHRNRPCRAIDSGRGHGACQHG